MAPASMSSVHEFVARVVDQPPWGADDFRLVDVGASGGIADRWNAFGDRLWAVGFDPLVAEIHRPAGIERRPKVHYDAAFVGWPHCDRVFPPDERADLIKTRHVQPFPRLSAVGAQRLMKQEYLDDYFRGQAPPDFLKIDTDGGDFLVLMGAERVLGRRCARHPARGDVPRRGPRVRQYVRQRRSLSPPTRVLALRTDAVPVQPGGLAGAVRVRHPGADDDGSGRMGRGAVPARPRPSLLRRDVRLPQHTRARAQDLLPARAVRPARLCGGVAVPPSVAP